MIALFNQIDAISCLANGGGNTNDESKSTRGSDQFSLGTDFPKLNLIILLLTLSTS